MKTILMLTAFAGAVALSACAPSMTPTPSTPSVEPTPVTCKAGDYQEYVGRNRSTIPAAPANARAATTAEACNKRARSMSGALLAKQAWKSKRDVSNAPA